MKFFLYILVSEVDQSLYIGQTQDISKRLVRHNRGTVKSTSMKRPWSVLFCKEFESRSAAFKTETYLKKLKSRKAIFTWIDKEGGV